MDTEKKNGSVDVENGEIEQPNKNHDKKEKIMLAVKIIIAAAIFLVIILNYKTLSNLDIKAILSKIDSIPLVIAASFGIYLLKACVFVVPASLIYISVGMVLKGWLGVLINCLGILLELVVSYFIGKFLGGEYVTKLLSKSDGGRKILKKGLQNNFLGIFLIRFSPLPIDLVSLLYGSTNASFLSYLGFSFLGVAPRVIALSIFGDKFWDIFNMKIVMTAALIVIPILIVVLLLKKFVIDPRKKKKTETDTDDTSKNSES